ncbi:MAG: hypothetical protein GQ582_07115 [Methyloprofundus sp.]|nr:hypothetical protein [Methyloprofundus sp.]
MNYALIGSIILSVSTLGGWLLVKYQHSTKSKQVKWALFVLFFWLLNFIQLIILAAIHYLMF